MSTFWPGPLTYRQHSAFTEWLKLEWNRPNRTDKQLILIASLIGNMFAKSPQSMDSFQLKYEFKNKKDLQDEEDFKRRESMSKQVWGMLGGSKATHRRISRAQAIEEGRIEA